MWGWAKKAWDKVQWVVNPGAAAVGAGTQIAYDGLAVQDERERAEDGRPAADPGSPAAAVAARSNAWDADRVARWLLLTAVLGGGGYALYRIGLATAMASPSYAMAAGQLGSAALQRGSGAADLLRAARGV